MDFINLGIAGVNAASQIGRNRKARHEAWITNERNIDFANQTNADNRQFVQDMWSKTNEYNSPAQQMERYKQAGLNPHLIYGQQPQASQPMSASTTAPHAERLPESTGLSDASQTMFMASQNYINNKKQQAEIDNLQKANEVMSADIRTKDASVAESFARTARSEYDLQLARDIRGNIVQDAVYNTQSKGLEVSKMEQEIRNSVKTGRLTDAQIEKAAQDVVQSKAQIKMLEMQGKVAEAELESKRLDNDLKRMGIQPTDSPLFRVPIRIYNNFKNTQMPWDDAPFKKQQYIKRSQR